MIFEELTTYTRCGACGIYMYGPRIQYRYDKHAGIGFKVIINDWTATDDCGCRESDWYDSGQYWR